MFENIINQKAIELITQDINAGRLPQAILFAGPINSAKCTSALELARVISCTEDAAWNCGCTSCNQMRAMNSVDLLIIGYKNLTCEIKASAQSFLKRKNISSHFLFSRSVKKLLIRFDPRLWDSDESRFTKASTIISDIQSFLDSIAKDFSSIEEEKSFLSIQKSVDKIIDLTEKLQNDCMYSYLPINQVRKASEWLHHAPTGKQKFLIIENAELMQEGARSAFLKILEEPPKHATFILTTTRPGAIMQTILSRVRKYNFLKRPRETEAQIVERIFHDTAQNQNIDKVLASYFNTFLPVSFEKIENAAKEFWFCTMQNYNSGQTSILRSSIMRLELEQKTIAQILADIDKAKSEMVFNLFIEQLVEMLRATLNTDEVISPQELEKHKRANEIIHHWKKAHTVYNLSVQSVLENISSEVGEIF